MRSTENLARNLLLNFMDLFLQKRTIFFPNSDSQVMVQKTRVAVTLIPFASSMSAGGVHQGKELRIDIN